MEFQQRQADRSDALLQGLMLMMQENRQANAELARQTQANTDMIQNLMRALGREI